jgi:hypothetical protein
MERFFTMRRLASFVRARQKARLAGTTLTYEQFQRDRSRRSALARVAEALEIWGGFCYRNAGLAAAEGAMMRAGLLLAASAGLTPWYTLRRFWNQVLRDKVLHPARHDA